jgi:hypothetical protein
MPVYRDEAYGRRVRKGRMTTAHDLSEAGHRAYRVRSAHSLGRGVHLRRFEIGVHSEFGTTTSRSVKRHGKHDAHMVGGGNHEHH